jgi:hypothetical protein
MSKSNNVTWRAGPTDFAHLAQLADAARSLGKPFVQRAAVIRAALAFASSNLDAFASIYL